MIDWFDYHGHMCIVFEMLGLSVFDFLVNLLYFKNGTRFLLYFLFDSARITTSHTHLTKCVTWPINFAIRSSFYMTIA